MLPHASYAPGRLHAGVTCAATASTLLVMLCTWQQTLGIRLKAIKYKIPHLSQSALPSSILNSSPDQTLDYGGMSMDRLILLSADCLVPLWVGRTIACKQINSLRALNTVPTKYYLSLQTSAT